MDEFDWVRSFSTSYGTVSHEFPAVEPRESPPSASRGSFASFVCHVTNLESKLRTLTPIVLDDSSSVRATGKILGQGKTFMVRHALWMKDPNEPPLDVALKEIIPDVQAEEEASRFASSMTNRPQVDWKEILFELRALLHEPVRYHPNIVRLLGIQWGLSPISESTFPVLIMEYASFGTFKTLQSSQNTLPLSVKQKLCYDVGRGLSALHSAGIVHGDMKHENVLIFPFKRSRNSNTAQVPYEMLYTAKLADFGGTVMDMLPSETRKLETWTWPFQAPEVNDARPLTREGMMLTDVYSFGLLVWRAFEDGDGFVSISGAAQSAPDEEKRSLSASKSTEELTQSALRSVKNYAASHAVPQAFFDIFAYTVFHTVRLVPKDRDLVKALAALRGIKPGHIPRYRDFVQEKNIERAVTEAREAPGRHGITRDALSFFLGRSGDDVDLQDNLPGFRPQLDEPNAEEFTFEPEKLKNILTWHQQRQMLEELKSAGSDTRDSTGGLLDMKKTVAAFYVFQCYLLEFGTVFNNVDASQWLLKAASDDDSHEDEDYLSQAWAWRISRALEVNLDMPRQTLDALLKLSVIRGHRVCLHDIQELASIGSALDRQQWWNTFQQARQILLSQMGGVGMGYFFSSHLNPPWNKVEMDNLESLDGALRAVLGSAYESCLRASSLHTSNNTGSDTEDSRFDRIYVNRRGHGLLHYAAAAGLSETLQHLVITYNCNIDLPNQHVDEPPLVCACAGGKLDCALFLLDNGADPNGYLFGQEGPLHWLSSFLPNEMEHIASRLVAAGAELELRSGGMRHDVRGIRADWEHTFEIRTTPLGRAVLMNNLDAILVLLKLGANPLAKSAKKHRGEWEGSNDMSKMMDVASPFELAAVLTYPEILAAFITHIDGSATSPTLRLLSEVGMLDLARSKAVTRTDPLSLQSRLVRCGSRYKQNLKASLTILYARALPFTGGMASDDLQKERSRVLSREVRLGNVDIVETLLELKYHPDGTQYHRPIEEAIRVNHNALFDLLKRYNANLSVTQMTPTGVISLLHACASRHRQSRPGRYIADALIAAGVPLESVDSRSKSPLAMAILNQNFDVAAALVDNGANVDALYPLQIPGSHGLETRYTTVLVEVLSQHTMRTIESLKFLFGKRNGSPKERPAFHTDPANKFSILHLLAGSPNFTHIAQITPKILSLCLETYNEPSLINYRHPLLGSALCYAAANGQKSMVDLLLKHGADVSVGAGPVVRDSVQVLLRPKTSWTPLWATILKLDEELSKGILLPSKDSPYDWLHSSLLQNLEKCVTFLSANNDDVLAQKAVERLRQKRRLVEEEESRWWVERHRNSQTTEIAKTQQPLDLGFLPGSASENDERKIRDICNGTEPDWRSGELGRLMRNMHL
ncbi:ankyrin [Karstenula rhodostoma CBS 690.94]|uniref:Ankyrin n=1 Tax=Karstenula rhodostoma CBS 690.94 TaxID=1392251 RepID=A0A9P4PG85_9PLEO|nr:ankyrin [Karstenula rhodostoma CBS 690.94]